MINRRELLGSVGAAAWMPAIALAAPASQEIPSAFTASLRLGPAQGGAGNHRWAHVVGGTISGGQLQGRVQSGRLEWIADPMSGAVSVAMTCRILRMDGTTVELRDCNVGERAAQLESLPGLPTAPLLLDDSGKPLAGFARLAGCLEADFGRSTAKLRAVSLS